MSKSLVISGFVGLAIMLVGCSGAEEGSSKKSDEVKSKPDAAAGSGSGGSSGGKVTDTSSTEPVDCVPAGTKGNAKGVGKFCQASSECESGTFCTAGVAPKGAEFCTSFCTDDADCGEGAACFQEARGRACVPNACLDLLK